MDYFVAMVTCILKDRNVIFATFCEKYSILLINTLQFWLLKILRKKAFSHFSTMFNTIQN